MLLLSWTYSVLLSSLSLSFLMWIKPDKSIDFSSVNFSGFYWKTQSKHKSQVQTWNLHFKLAKITLFLSLSFNTKLKLLNCTSEWWQTQVKTFTIFLFRLSWVFSSWSKSSLSKAPNLSSHSSIVSIAACYRGRSRVQIPAREIIYLFLTKKENIIHNM